MVEETAHGFRTSLDVASELIKFICGRKMETKLRIEKETSTQIRLPKPGMEAPVGKKLSICMVIYNHGYI